jgi:hypothetical protein
VLGTIQPIKAKADIKRKISKRTPPTRYNGKGHLMGSQMILKNLPTEGEIL